MQKTLRHMDHRFFQHEDLKKSSVLDKYLQEDFYIQEREDIQSMPRHRAGVKGFF